MSKVNDVLPTVSPQTPDEYYAQWVDREGVNAEKVRDDSLTAIQRAYDRSSATYGATAEMLRQSGLNNSGLAGLYQNMAETNRRQGNATVYDQYAANVKSNKSRFAAHNQEIQGKIYEQAMTMPEATMQDLQAIAAMYGVDPITAQQMAQSAWDSTTDIRERGLQAKYTEAYNEAYKEINEIASQGGNLNAEAIAARFPDLGADALSVVQGIINERKENYSSVYANVSASNMYTDLVNGTLKESDLYDSSKEEEIAQKYGVPKGKFDEVIANAQTAYDEYKGEKNASDRVTAQNNISGKSVGFDVTDDMVKDFASSLGISEDIAREYLEKERDDTISAANYIWSLYKKGTAFFHSPDEVKNELDEYYGFDFTPEEARLIYNYYVDMLNQEKAKIAEDEARKARVQRTLPSELKEQKVGEMPLPKNAMEASAQEFYQSRNGDLNAEIKPKELEGIDKKIVDTLAEGLKSVYRYIQKARGK